MGAKHLPPSPEKGSMVGLVICEKVLGAIQQIKS